MRPIPIGIDLGTTHTLASGLGATGHTEILALDGGGSLLPSVVFFADDRTVVGHEAQRRGRQSPERLAACVKRSMGQPFYEHSIDGEWLPPEVLQACILRQLRVCQRQIAQPTTRAVIAVPAHFNATQRFLTNLAAEMAGLPCLDLIDEPLAAALAFLEDAPALVDEGRHHPLHLLVVDLGGYTCEVSALAVRPGDTQILASGHDLSLGGHAWDLRLVDRFAAEWRDAGHADPRQSPAQLVGVLAQARQIKHGLSDHTSMHYQWDKHATEPARRITRAEFEFATHDLVERLIQMCDETLAHASLDWSRLRQVLLVGGATRMPMIERRLVERLGRAVETRVAPDEAVARGAALCAAQLLRHERPPPALRPTSICTHGIGVEGVEPATGRRRVQPLISRGAELPARGVCELRIARRADETHEILVLEGDHTDPRKCQRVAQISIRLPSGPQGSEWTVDVACELDVRGQLVVTAAPRGGEVARLKTYRPTNASKTDAEHWTAAIEAQAGFEAYRQVRAWEREADAPLVVLGGTPANRAAENEVSPTPQPTEREGTAEETVPDSERSWLARLMPFLTRP